MFRIKNGELVGNTYRMFANVFNVALVVNLTVRMIGRKIVPGGLRARTGGMKIRRGKNISGCCK